VPALVEELPQGRVMPLNKTPSTHRKLASWSRNVQSLNLFDQSVKFRRLRAARGMAVDEQVAPWLSD
jgi:hypothetical protein